MLPLNIYFGELIITTLSTIEGIIMLSLSLRKRKYQQLSTVGIVLVILSCVNMLLMLFKLTSSSV